MARNFRIEKLSPEDQRVLQQLAQYDPTALSEIEKTGQLPDRIASKLDPSSLSSINALLSKLPSQTDALKSYVDSQKDIPNLTDQELQDRKSALEGLSGTGQSHTSGTDKLKDYFRRQLGDKTIETGGRALTKEVINQIAEYSVNNLKAGTYDPQHVVNIVVSNLGTGHKGSTVDLARTYANDIPKDYTREVQSGQYNDSSTPGLDTSGDITSVNDIVTARAKKSAANADIMSFFNAAPGEAAASRAAFFDPERARAKDYIQNVYQPTVREQLAARGLQNSGEVASAVTGKYADLFGSINASEADQIASDVSFFGQQSYDKTFSDLVNAGADVRATINTARNATRTHQITEFGKKQADIESRFNLDLFRDQSRAAYDTYQKQVSDQSAAKRSQDEADMIANAAGTAVNTGVAIKLGSMK